VDADPQLWLDRDVVNLPAARVREVTVRRANEAELVLARGEASDGAKLALSAPPGHRATTSRRWTTWHAPWNSSPSST
jgi:hypothetical protein